MPLQFHLKFGWRKLLLNQWDGGRWYQLPIICSQFCLQLWWCSRHLSFLKRSSSLSRTMVIPAYEIISPISSLDGIALRSKLIHLFCSFGRWRWYFNSYVFVAATFLILWFMLAGERTWNFLFLSCCRMFWRNLGWMKSRRSLLYHWHQQWFSW